MSTTWLDLKHPLGPPLEHLLRDLDHLFRSRGIPYLLTGGMAREILLHHGYGCPTGRLTTDVDFGVTLSSWQDFQALKDALEDSGTFHPDPRMVQRMIYRPAGSTFDMNIDLVPFGTIAGSQGEIAWPPDGSHVMRVLGYAQALTTAIHVRLDDACWIPLASAPGLVIMKLMAWMDQGEARLGRDAVDFIEVLRQCPHVLTDQELYDHHPESMERYDFRVEPAAAYILGKQVADLADEPLRHTINEALRPASREKMLNHFLRSRSLVDSSQRLAETSELLESFEAGWRG